MLYLSGPSPEIGTLGKGVEDGHGLTHRMIDRLRASDKWKKTSSLTVRRMNFTAREMSERRVLHYICVHYQVRSSSK